MALELKYASDATALLNDLVDALGRTESPAGVVVPVLMPSLPLVDRTKAEMARRHGVAMGVEFLLPGSFIERIAKRVGLGPVHPSWRPEGLAWRLLPLLAAVVEEGHTPRLESACVDDRARQALAAELADRFDQYLYFRPSMIAAWDRGEAFGDPLELPQDDEAWQRKLWRRLSDGLAGHANPAVRLQELVARVGKGDGELPPSLEVLATGPLPPTLLPLLRALATRTRVCLRALLPSTEYLGDIKAGRTQMRTGQAVDLDWEGHPLLSHLGKQAVDTFRSFENALVTEGQEYDVVNDPQAQPTSDTLLARLQADIRAARQPGDMEGMANTAPLLEPDRSMRVHRCHGARREVEVLRDELLDAFCSLPNLQASDVLILAPDLDTYGPLAEAVLKTGEPSLPLRLSERRLDRSDPVVRGMQMLLRLAAGRAPLSEGLALLELPAVSACLEALGTDPEMLSDRLRASGITWGINAAHREALDAGAQDTGTWRAGLDRLLAGLWLGDADASSDAHQHPALPVAGDLGADPASMSASLDWLEGLVRLLEDWQAPTSPGLWAERMDLALEQILVGMIGAEHGGADPAAAVDLIDQLRAAETEHACVLPMAAAAVGDWLDRAAEEEIRAVSRVGGGMAMGGFKPMRAIPCRVLAVLGLHDAAFPRRTRAPAWDLLAAAPRPGDRDPVLEDRQLFLDAILAAGDRVILTASARNIRSNKDEPLSACVDELLRVAAATVGREPAALSDAYHALIDDHPLQPFSASCFTGARASFDTGHLEVARACRQREEVATPFQTGTVEPPDEVRSADLELHEMIRVLKDPWTTWLGSLGVVLPQEVDDPFALDREPVAAPSGLDRWQLQTEVIATVLAGRATFLEDRLAADRLMPYGRLGAAMAAETVRQAVTLARSAMREAGGPLQPHRLAYRDGNPQVAGSITVGPDRTLHVLVMPTELKDKPHHRLDVWVRATFAAACGMCGDTLVVSKDAERVRVVRMPPMDPAQARTALDALLQICEEARRRPLPFGPKTSHAIFAANRKGRNEVDAGLKAWAQQPKGPPGEGDSASAQLAWRDRDPFATDTIDEWRRLAAEVFGPVEAWFAQTAATSRHGASSG
jgi:exodeoxyribonuclease V gamma subunit